MPGFHRRSIPKGIRSCSLDDYAYTIQRAYRRDYWADQRQRVELWSEKGTIRGTVGAVLNQYAVTFRVMHGHASSTAINDAARYSRRLPTPLIVLYTGDWDPSGLDMSERDIPGRLQEYGGNVILKRIALTAEDIADLSLPSFDADDKVKDPRYPWFRATYGATCWELDALSPVVLRQRLADEILNYVDPVAWLRAEQVEAVERRSLIDVLGTWNRSISGPA